MQRQSPLEEQRPEIPEADFNLGDSAALSPDVLDNHPYILFSSDALCGPRGGPAVGLRGLRRVDPVEADRDLPTNRPADPKSISVGHLYASACEGLARLYGSISSRLSAGRSYAEDEKKRA
jgi:hypothetical protein